MKQRNVSRAAFALALAGIAGCSGSSGGDSPANSTLSVSLMDAPVDGVTAVYVQITAMWIKPQGGPPVELDMPAGPISVNLLELTDTNAAILVDDVEIQPGRYEWLAMDIAAERGVRDSYVLTETGGEEEIEAPPELQVPSGRLRLVSGFDVGPNEAVRLLFDWDMRQGLVYPPGQGQYFLKPAFRMIDVTEYGVLEGTIAKEVVGTDLDETANNCATDDPDAANLEKGNVVYVFAEGVVPNDNDGDDDAVATIVASREDTANNFTYRTLLEPGKYNIVFTCEGANDEPEAADDITFLSPANATNPVEVGGNTTTVNF